MPHRSELERYLDVLAAIINGEQKSTRLIFCCNLGWKEAHRMVERFVSSGLAKDVGLEEDDKRALHRYVITELGFEVYKTLMGAYILLELVPNTEVPEIHEKLRTVRNFKPVEVES